jgi:hypothetical protein
MRPLNPLYPLLGLGSRRARSYPQPAARRGMPVSERRHRKSANGHAGMRLRLALRPAIRLVCRLTMIAMAASVVGISAVRAQGLQVLPAFTGPAVGLELIRGSAWSFDEEIPELGRSEPHDIPASTGVGAHLSYAVTPYLAPFVAGSVSLYGEELTGFNTHEGGIEVRVPKVGAAVLPFAQASLGRLHWSGDMRYTYVGLGAGAELFLSGRLAVRLGLRGTWPVADGRRNVGPAEAPVYRTATLDAAQLRLSAGICWHLRRRR